MAHRLLKDLPAFAEKRFLYFFNHVPGAKEIASVQWKTSDKDADEYGLGETVAQRIIDARNSLERKKFTDLSAFEEIPGLGHEKLKDIVSTFSIPAADLFLRDMRKGVIQSNFELTYYSIPFDQPASFEAVVSNPRLFKYTVAKYAKELASEGVSQEKLVAAEESLRSSYVETYKNGFVGSYAFALWFFRFDADNWFTFEQVRTCTESYLDITLLSSDRQELHLFKGFQAGEILVGGICPEDLPVVVNHDEHLITLWGGQLFD